MSNLVSCTDCTGFVPVAAIVCPHCDHDLAPLPNRRSRFARLSRTLFGVAGGGALAITLMACYGSAAMYNRPQQPPPQCTPAMDEDRDGVCPPDDCDNTRADVYPNAVDKPGDGIDQNCDGADGIAGTQPTPSDNTRATDPVAQPPTKATP